MLYSWFSLARLYTWLLTNNMLSFGEIPKQWSWMRCQGFGEWVPGGGVGRGRLGALICAPLVGANSASFNADVEGEEASGCFVWIEPKNVLNMADFYSACVCLSWLYMKVCTCAAGGLSIWGLRICKASSRGVCFLLNLPSGLLNASTRHQQQTLVWRFFSADLLYITCKYNHSQAVCSLQAVTSQSLCAGSIL